MKLTVTVSGPKCSGKTTIARELAAFLDRYDVRVSGEVAGGVAHLDDVMEYDPALEVEFKTADEVEPTPVAEIGSGADLAEASLNGAVP